ncbi:dUTP diphosphatase [Paenibacillus agricola]|uniref:dUTP diphosphatase n=1 Tax=Paenibacillus agricola TaxID=2716264 RepID=A0ABX0JBT0_9BACL|nr:dUTP diphosphatase [Paenibacillus agricola]NHN31155.1 dUTP diphosphatase [Paenibacillus agricola]
MLNVKIRKLHEAAQIPAYATEGAAAFDLVAVSDAIIAPGETVKIPLGLAFEIPAGYVMIVAMRSGIALKTKLRQPNGVGVIDSDYRGEVAMMFDNITPIDYELDSDFDYETGAYTDYKLRESAPFAVTIDGKECFSCGASGAVVIRAGDRVCQAFIQPLPRVAFVESAELSETERGAGGFGHSGVRTEVGV